MFYVESFFNIFKKQPIKTFFVVFFSSIFVFSISNKTYLTKISNSMFSASTKSDNYFNFLLDKGASHQHVIRKLRNLPGVKKIILTSSKELDQKLTELKFESDIINNYTAIKVIFNQNLKSTSVNLVVNYLKQMVRSDKIIIGRIHRSKISKPELSMEFIINSFSAIIFLLFMIIFYIWTVEMKRYSFLIEQYQNKKYASIKISSIFLLLILLLNSLVFVNIKYTSPKWFIVSFVILSSSTLLLSVKNKWQF